VATALAGISPRVIGLVFDRLRSHRVPFDLAGRLFTNGGCKL
jgi:hypothetical protein